MIVGESRAGTAFKNRDLVDDGTLRVTKLSLAAAADAVAVVEHDIAVPLS